MELWWWIEPLIITGAILAFPALGAMGSDSRFLNIVGVILAIPLVVAIGSAAMWFGVNVFLAIWKPYL